MFSHLGRGTEPGTGQGGSAEVGTAGGHTTSAGSGTQPAGGGCSMYMIYQK